jgi:hypothetical protein
MVERFLRAEPLPQPLESFIARVPIGGDERFRELRVLHLSVSLSLSLARFTTKNPFSNQSLATIVLKVLSARGKKTAAELCVGCLFPIRSSRFKRRRKRDKVLKKPLLAPKKSIRGGERVSTMPRFCVRLSVSSSSSARALSGGKI